MRRHYVRRVSGVCPASAMLQAVAFLVLDSIILVAVKLKPLIWGS